MSTFVNYYFNHDLDTSSQERCLNDIRSRLCFVPDTIQGENHIILVYKESDVQININVFKDNLVIGPFPAELPLSIELKAFISKLQGSKADTVSPFTPQA